jgi:cobalt/nickel transport system permease protein
MFEAARASYQVEALVARAVVPPGQVGSGQPTPMHIPDGFLSTPVALLMWVVAVVAVAYALRRVSRDLDERRVPLLGVLAAAIFAGQMLNFSVTGGTSGHLLGAAIAAILLGPWGALLVITCVVGTQAILFQDGGLLALGANIFNMAVVGVAVSYAIYSLVNRLAGSKRWGVFAGSFLAGWFSIVIASLACALELAVSGTSPANIAVPAMGGIHMLIGIGEGLITVGAVTLLYAARRDLLEAGKASARASRGLVIGGLLVAIVLALFAPWASTHPDGLEWVAEQKGFLELAREAPFQLIPDYVFPGISNEALATIAAGVIGSLVVFGVAWSVALTRRGRETAHRS